MLTPQFLLPLAAKLVIDLFAGGGGASTGIEQAIGRPVDVAINHDADAIGMHEVNHPQTRHYRSDIREVDPLSVTKGELVGLLHASLDCTHHSQALGGQPRNGEIRSLAWIVIRWAGKTRPEVITLENVEQMMQWSPLIAKRDPATGRVITLEDRINGCFLRSMNGKPLPLESDEIRAMVAYFDWMRRETKPEDKVEGRGVGKISQSIVPNVDNGKKVYAAQCAVCHGGEGEGVKNAKGQWVYPPLWGDQSFNIGAGMARTYTAAAFVKRNMPIAFHGNFPLGQGGLSDQEAVDVAEYFSHQPRPDFANKHKDWPKDKKPADARY